MRVYNIKHSNLRSNLLEVLSKFRIMRGFSVDNYIESKTSILNEYMRSFSLNACVVAVSGGIDSAVVLSLVVEASKKKNSPIKKIVAISLPVQDTTGATNQKTVVEKAQQLCDSLSIDLKVFNVKRSFEQIHPQVDELLEQEKPDSWALGQLVAYARTPFLYYATSVLSSQGFGSIIVGTTNRDEGAYLGYVGKASDGMVDIQLISDLHKSEVFQVGKKLGVVNSIMNANPTGDMYDGRSDEDVFGAPYDFVELYLNYKNLSVTTWNQLTKNWEVEDFNQFKQYQEALEKLHRYNKHKYLSGSQAVHLDILQSAVKHGWIEGVHSNLYKSQVTKVIPTHRFVGFVDKSPILTPNAEIVEIEQLKYDIRVVKNLLSNEEIKAILNWREENISKMVRTNQYGKVNVGSSGSKRLSFYSEDFAQIISERLKLSGSIPDLFCFSFKDKTNWQPSSTWRFIGVNPMVRLMEYEEKDYLVPHYDDSFFESDKRRSLITLVIVISNDCVGGATRFIRDVQDLLPFENRDFSDWDCEPSEEEILLSVKPNCGGAILFPHRLLHDGQKIQKGKKIILRTELMFEICSINFLK